MGISSNIHFAQAVPKVIQQKFTVLSSLNGSSLQLYLRTTDLQHNIDEGDFDLRLYFDGRSLVNGTHYPQNIKVEIYTMKSGQKDLLAIINRTLKSRTASKNILLRTRIPRLEETTDINIDIYDSHNTVAAEYLQEIVISNPDGSPVASHESVPDYTCASGDGECLIEYLLSHVSFSASYDRNLKTEVTKNDKGRYTVAIPIKKGRLLKKKVKKFNLNSKNGNGGSSAGNDGEYPYFESESQTASSFWNQVRDAIEYSFSSTNNFFSFKSDGSLQLNTNNDSGFVNISAGTNTKAPIVFEKGDLLDDPVDGALEFDGVNLYLTSGGTRTLLGAQGPAGPPGPPGFGAGGSGIDLLKNCQSHFPELKIIMMTGFAEEAAVKHTCT